MTTQRPVLAGRRMTLRLLERSHLPQRVAYINDPEVQRTLNFDYPTSMARTEAWYSKIVLSNDRVDFAFEVPDRGHPIGFGGLISIDRRVRKAELYIMIGDKDFWGHGFGRDGYKLLTNYAFTELGLERLYAYHLEHNQRAANAVTKLGWRIEGLLRKDVWSHGAPKSRFVAAILRGEWLSNEAYDDV